MFAYIIVPDQDMAGELPAALVFSSLAFDSQYFALRRDLRLVD
jgi:hypothetical protein